MQVAVRPDNWTCSVDFMKGYDLSHGADTVRKFLIRFILWRLIYLQLERLKWINFILKHLCIWCSGDNLTLFIAFF